MRQIKLFSAQTDDADDAAKELQTLLREWEAENPRVETESATTSVSVTYDPDAGEPLVAAIMTVIYRGMEQPKAEPDRVVRA